MDLLEVLKPSEEDMKWLVPEFFRRAAAAYEQAERWHDAAECWTEAGERARAAALYLRSADHAKAAPLLLVEGRYTEALEEYRRWLASLPLGEVIGQVTAQLGVAACLTLMATEPAVAREAYRVARAVVESETRRHPLVAGQCWEALGTYGVTVRRDDLILLGYERALACYGERYNGERARAALAYRAAVQENRLLAAEIEARLAEWELTEERVKVEKRVPDRAVEPSNLESVDFSELEIGEGALFGEWIVWRAGLKSVLLTHARTSTALEIWTDSPGWFHWAQHEQHRVHSDGSTTNDVVISSDLRVYHQQAPTYILAHTSAQIDNYLLLCSRENLQITNTKDRGKMIILPATAQFQFVPWTGRSISLGSESGVVRN